MRVKIWGARGSVPSPGPETIRYGGNTACVQVTLDDGTVLVLDAGTGIRNLGVSLGARPQRLHILLTHLHLDHIQGLMFFPPAFMGESEIVLWGPAAPGTLQDRLARYISAPLTPVEIRELPSDVTFRDCPGSEWQIGSATVRATSVIHRGPTLGFRITEGDSTLCYLPDHEPGLGPDRLDDLDPEWISGFDLARDATLLIHDCQYTDREYGNHIGWGHSRLSDALVFASRTRAERVLLFHHDPLHSDDFLDSFYGTALGRWEEVGGDPDRLEMAFERRELLLGRENVAALHAAARV